MVATLNAAMKTLRENEKPITFTPKTDITLKSAITKCLRAAPGTYIPAERVSSLLARCVDARRSRAHLSGKPPRDANTWRAETPANVLRHARGGTEHSYSEASKKKTKLATADVKIAAGLTDLVTAHEEIVDELTELVIADAAIVRVT